MLAEFDFSELSPAAWYTPIPVSTTIWDLIAPTRDMFCAFLAKLLPGLAFGLLVYFGSIHWDWLVDIVFRGFAWLKTGWPLLCKFSTETYRVAGLAPLLSTSCYSLLQCSPLVPLSSRTRLNLSPSLSLAECDNKSGPCRIGLQVCQNGRVLWCVCV